MLKTTIPIPDLFPLALADLVREAFLKEAGPVAVEGVRDVLGTAAMDLALSTKYSDRKKEGKIADMKRFPGKDDDQPGILTGSLYEGVDHQEEPGIGFSVGVESAAGIANGDDYAEDLEKRTEYLEKGVQSKEAEMKEIFDTVLARVIAEATTL